MSKAGEFGMEFRPSFVGRFWRALGFRYAAYVARPDDDESCYTVHRTITRCDWRDSLRILISGKTEIELCIETEKVEKVKGVQTDACVLAPNARLLP